MKFFLSYHQTSNLFYKIFILIFLIGSALIIGFSGVIYHRTYQNIQETFLQSQHNLVNQVKENLDQLSTSTRDQFTTGLHWCDGDRKRQLPIGEFESALENRRRLLKTDR